MSAVVSAAGLHMLFCYIKSFRVLAREKITALHIENGIKAICKGSGMIIIINGKNIEQANIDLIEGGCPVYVENLYVHLLTENYIIDLNT